jgi:hypothetical protein
MRQHRGADVKTKKNRNAIKDKSKKDGVKTHAHKKPTTTMNDVQENRDSLMQETLTSTTSMSTSRSLDELLTVEDFTVPDIYDPTRKKFEQSGKPGTKTKRLQRLLEEAEKKRARLSELKSQGEEGIQRAKEELWVDALKEASGEKVFDSTTEIRKVLYYNNISSIYSI